MASNRPHSAPCPDPGGTVTSERIRSMSAADHYDPDAITRAESWRASYKSDELLDVNKAFKDKESVAECCDSNASVAAVESQLIFRKHAEPPTGADSPGYRRTAIMKTQILTSEKLIIFVSILVLATWHSLDNFLRALYQIEVVMDYEQSGMLGALSTIPTLGAATLTPLISKSADVFGRPETLTASIASYVLGTALQAKASSMELFCIGTIFWTIGFLGVISMFEIIIADLTSMRLRVVVFYLPAIPYLITTWLSATLRNAIIQACPSVQWRFAWSAILYTACSAPLVMAMFIIERRAKNRLSPSQSQTVPRDSMRGRVARTLLRLRQMDILGWICFVGIVTCLLAPWAAVPVVAPHGPGAWLSPAMISVSSTGLLCIPIFYYVEKYSKYPMFPAQLLGERKILTALIMGFLYHLAYYVQYTYLYIGLGIRYAIDDENSTRIVGLYTFTSTFVGLFIGVIISITRDLRWYLRFGAMFYLASFVIQYTRPSGKDNVSHLAVTCSQVLLGIAGGLFPFPAMAFVQGARDHTQLSTLIGAYMTACRVGSGIGQSLAGAIWTNALRPRLYKRLEGLDVNIEILYAIPTAHEELYPWDSILRRPIVDAFVDSHRYLCAVGIIASTLLIILAFLIQDASLEVPQADEEVELGPRSEGNVEPKEAMETRQPLPLRPSRHPIIM